MTEPADALGWLALARGTLDRVADRRRDDPWLARAWADPRSRVLVIEDGRVPVRFDGAPALAFVSPDAAPEGERYLLGTDEGVVYFAVSGPLPPIEGTEPATLRRVGALLGDRDSALVTYAVALRNWHATHVCCPRCGGRTDIVAAGHVRMCPADGSEHFPRVDPAVIMLVYDARDRVLLAHGTGWPDRRVSVLAGFVEPGESLEQAVVREVREEVGLVVRDPRYLGSQPWPLPRSLMFGFLAHADDGQELVFEPGEIEYARWFTREDLQASAQAQEILLPGKISIARQLIESWYGGELPGTWGH